MIPLVQPFGEHKIILTIFCTSHEMAIDKLLLANRNTKPEGGKTAVPTGINNAQTTYSQKPCPTVKGYVPVVP
jgi:hypothetical protein